MSWWDVGHVIHLHLSCLIATEFCALCFQQWHKRWHETWFNVLFKFIGFIKRCVCMCESVSVCTKSGFIVLAQWDAILQRIPHTHPFSFKILRSLPIVLVCLFPDVNNARFYTPHHNIPERCHTLYQCLKLNPGLWCDKQTLWPLGYPTSPDSGNHKAQVCHQWIQ